MRVAAAVSLPTVALVILLSACAVGHAGPGGGMAAGMPQDAGADDSLSLGECLEIAMRNNPRIAYSGFRVEAARAERDVAASQRWPILKSMGSYARYSATERMYPPSKPLYPLVYADEVLAWNIHASIPLFTGGRIRNEVKAFEFLEDSARDGLEFTRRKIEYEVMDAFYGILKQQMVIESLWSSRMALGEQADNIEALIAAGKAARADLLRVEVRLADIAQRTETEKAVLAVYKRILLNLIGLDREDIAIKPDGDLCPDFPEVDIEDALSSAYSDRPDYLAARKEVEAQERRVRATRAAYWPSASLFASYSGKHAVGSYIEVPGSANPWNIARVGCLLEFPIFEGGKRGAELDREKAKLAGMENELRALKLQVRLEVESAVHYLESARKRLAATDKAVELAQESRRIESEKYDLGKGTITDVLDVESALLEMRAARYSAMVDYNMQIARIRFVTGEYNDSYR